MATVSAGTTASVTLTSSNTITITCDPTEKALVSVVRGAVSLFAGQLGNANTIGPYLADDVLTVTANRGDVDYTLASYTAPTTGSYPAPEVGYTVGGNTINASNVGNADVFRVFSGGTVTLALDLATSRRMISFVPQAGEPDFTIAFASGITVLQEAGTTLSSAEAVGRTVIVLFQAGGVARVLSGLKPRLGRTPSLRKWAVKFGAALAGNANARIGIVGDSTSAGILTGSTGKAAQSPSATLARVLARSGIAVNHNSAFGNAMRVGGSTFTTYDPRWVTNGAWATLSSFWSIGGNTFQNATDTATLSFTPRDPVTGALYSFDTFDLYYGQTTGYGTFTVNVDGGATLATVDSNNATRAMVKLTISVTAGTHTINIQRTAGGTVMIYGIAPSVSATKGIEIFNIAAGSYTSADLVATTGAQFAFPTCYSQLALDLSIIDIGINDRRLAAYTSAFSTNLQAVVTAAKAMGECILCIPAPSSITATAFSTQANQDLFDSAIRDIARANDCMVYDKRALFGTYEAANPLGWYSDTLHPSAGGYGRIGFDLAEVIAL